MLKGTGYWIYFIVYLHRDGLCRTCNILCLFTLRFCDSTYWKICHGSTLLESEHGMVPWRLAYCMKGHAVCRVGGTPTSDVLKRGASLCCPFSLSMYHNWYTLCLAPIGRGNVDVLALHTVGMRPYCKQDNRIGLHALHFSFQEGDATPSA